VRPRARDLVGDRLGTRRKIGLPDSLDREHECREVIAGIRCSQSPNDQIDVGADVEILRHHGNLGRVGLHSLFRDG